MKTCLTQSFLDQVTEYYDLNPNVTVKEIAYYFGVSVKTMKAILLDELTPIDNAKGESN